MSEEAKRYFQRDGMNLAYGFRFPTQRATDNACEYKKTAKLRSLCNKSCSRNNVR